ncbi:Rha family transcriptional regulator [Acinetobacter sp. ULE_I010]|uniref:Rha family transcriptional regulator n=1 Tax=Acinetobacter sp. ULE_I010 TaxID=3373065 RepID=UPI003AF91E7C
MNALDLSQAVFIQNQQIKTDSLKVAGAFGKRHTNVLRAIESLDCPKEFSELNFELANYIDEQGKPRPMYEMTKDGWMFLVMGFTGEKAAQIKIAFINAFNAMATLLQNQQITQLQGIAVGSKVRLNSGSPELTVNRLISNSEGVLESIEVTWFSNRLHKSILSIHTVVSAPVLQNDELQQFWQSIYKYGLEKINHSKYSHLIAINLVHISKVIPNFEKNHELTNLLKNSAAPYPKFIKCGQVWSGLETKNVKCWVFENNSQPLLSRSGASL